MTRKQGFVAVLITLANLVVWALVLGCANTTTVRHDRHVESAQASYITYRSLAPLVAHEIFNLVNASKFRRLDEVEKNRLRKLNVLGGQLEDYRQLHEMFISSLVVGSKYAKIGEVRFPEKNQDSPEMTLKKMRTTLKEITRTALSLNISFHAVMLP